MSTRVQNLSTAQLAQVYVAGTQLQPLLDEDKSIEVLKEINRRGDHQTFDRWVGQFSRANGYKDFNAMDVAYREMRGNWLKRLLYSPTKYLRFKDAYFKGRDTHSGNAWQYFREGLAQIPLNLATALIKHPVMTVGVLVGLGFVASFTPFWAAMASYIITGLSVAGFATSGLKSLTAPQGSEQRAEGFKGMGESLAAILINLLPLKTVHDHVDEGVQAAETAYKSGFKYNFNPAHADDAGGNILQDLMKIHETTLGLCKVGGRMIGNLLKYPLEVAKNPAKAMTQGKDALLESFFHGSNLPKLCQDVARGFQKGEPMIAVKTLVDGIKAQAALVVTLIDEALVPFLKVLDAMKAKQTSG